MLLTISKIAERIKSRNFFKDQITACSYQKMYSLLKLMIELNLFFNLTGLVNTDKMELIVF